MDGSRQCSLCSTQHSENACTESASVIHDSCPDLNRSKCTDSTSEFTDQAYLGEDDEDGWRHSGINSARATHRWWQPSRDPRRRARRTRRRYEKLERRIGEASNPGPNVTGVGVPMDATDVPAGDGRDEAVQTAGSDAQQAMKPPPPRTSKRDKFKAKSRLPTEFWAANGFFVPAKAFRGAKEGMHFKLGECGLGYYKDYSAADVSQEDLQKLDGSASAHEIAPSGSKQCNDAAQGRTDKTAPVSLLLDVLIPPEVSKRKADDDGGVKHMRKPRKGPDKKIMSVNPNSMASLIETLKQGGVPDDIDIIAVQEAKVLGREVGIREQDLADLGWDAYINQCNGEATSRSSGVALLARRGWRVTNLTAANSNVRGLNSARLGAWAVEGCFTGGFVNFIAYLIDGISMNGQNLEILANITRGAAALGRPYIVLTDWNMTPEDVSAHKWLNGVKGRIVRSGGDMVQPTKNDGIKRAEYDFAVVSGHWGETTRADLNSGVKYTPHYAVTFHLPAKTKVALVDELRAPFKFPIGTPFVPHANPEEARTYTDLQRI